MQNKTIFIFIAVGLFIASLVGGYYGPSWFAAHQEAKVREAFIIPAVPKKQLEDFSKQFASTLTATEPMFLPPEPFLDMKGSATSIKDFEGRPTLVNLWATWCAPCVVELPSLAEFSKAYEGRINVIAIAVGEGKKPDAIAQFLKGRQLDGLSAYVDQEGGFATKIGMRGIPTSFLLGSNGQILYRFEGDANWMAPDSRAFFDVFVLQNK